MNLKQTIKKILKEETTIPIKLRRRLYSVDLGLEYLINKFYSSPDICDRYAGYDEYVQVISDAVAEKMYIIHFSDIDIDDMGNEWDEIYTGIMNYIETYWEEKIINNYNNICNKEERINEEESKEDKIRKKIIFFIEENGIKLAIDFFGGWDKIRSILIGYEIPKKWMIDLIKDVIDIEGGGLSVFDLNEDPIFYGKTENEYREIYYFAKERVFVKVWDMDTMDDKGEFSVSYENLDYSSLYDVFDYLLEHYVKIKGEIDESKINENITQTSAISDKDKNFQNFQNTLNKFMPRTFEWWKNIKLSKLLFTKTKYDPDEYLYLHGELTVDIEWGAKQWSEFHYSSYFPGNDSEQPVLLGDITNGDQLQEILNEIEVFSMTIFGLDAQHVFISRLELKFE